MEEYEPRHRLRRRAVLDSLLTFLVDEGMSSIESCERDLVEYEDQTTDRFLDNIKLNVLFRDQEDEALRRHLQSNRREWTAADDSGSTPTHLDAMWCQKRTGAGNGNFKGYGLTFQLPT